jgi:hypothetical protein
MELADQAWTERYEKAKEKLGEQFAGFIKS